MDEIAKNHHAGLAWTRITQALRAEIGRRGVHPARCVVLLPFAQLMREAKAAWMADAGAPAFVPRFETTMNWTRSLGSFVPGPHDIRRDAAFDMLTAASMLAGAGLGGSQAFLARRVMEAAWSLARVAAAVPPAQRLAWGQRLGAALGTGLDAPVLALEVAVARVALAWAATSGYPTDALFSAQPELLVVIDGFQKDPLAEALKLQFSDRLLVLPLDAPGEPGQVALHQAVDAEDEAHLAAACVLAHLAQGRIPVALVAQDRVLTRRVRALLDSRQVVVRDETGWTLSTTRAAAGLMSLLRAVAWDASADAVLDWLKNAPAFDAMSVMVLESQLRKDGIRQWRQAPPGPFSTEVNTVRDSLTRSRPLSQWLRELRAALQRTGQWELLTDDLAGQAVLDALRLHEDAEAEFAPWSARIPLSDFTGWVNQVLESASFTPAHPASEQVVILPLSQLLGRSVQAVVLPGCDENRLPMSPDPVDAWTTAQRELLGLPSRDELMQAQCAAWQCALRFPHLDVLWRRSENGESIMPGAFVQQWRLAHGLALADDARVTRTVAASPTPAPHPDGSGLPVARLSASAYEDLRRCPYRFFALRQLKLAESDELDAELGKREFGSWMHALLKQFHEALHASPTTDAVQRAAMLDAAAAGAARELGLDDSEFLPFNAAWPRVRDGYLQWLGSHDATGAVYQEGEAWRELPLGALTLHGRIDRIDRIAEGAALVIDYKTEALQTTRERVRQPLEDTQLAFYAALLSDDTLGAAYVNIGEKEGTRTVVQDDIVALRDQLVEAIVDDMQRVAGGAPLRALGEGKVCDTCAARGLCRRDFRGQA